MENFSESLNKRRTKKTIHLQTRNWSDKVKLFAIII